LKKDKEDTNIIQYFDNKGLRGTEMSHLVIKEDKTVEAFDRVNFLKKLKEDKKFRNNFIGIAICNCVSSFIIDLFSYIIPNLSGNIYMNAISVSLFQIGAYTMSGFAIKHLGLKRQIMLSYAFPFVISLMYLSLAYLLNLTLSSFTYSIVLGLIMFGLSANFSSTLYAAYSLSPAPLAPTFLVVLNLFKICMLSFTPFIADSFQPGASSSRFLIIFFMVASLVCWVASWYFLEIREKKKNKGGVKRVL
jgi:hypothetical protein